MTKYVEKVEYIQQNKLADFKPNEKEKEAMLKESVPRYFSIEFDKFDTLKSAMQTITASIPNFLRIFQRSLNKKYRFPVSCFIFDVKFIGNPIRQKGHYHQREQIDQLQIRSP